MPKISPQQNLIAFEPMTTLQLKGFSIRVDRCMAIIEMRHDTMMDQTMRNIYWSGITTIATVLVCTGTISGVSAIPSNDNDSDQKVSDYTKAIR